MAYRITSGHLSGHVEVEQSDDEAEVAERVIALPDRSGENSTMAEWLREIEQNTLMCQTQEAWGQRVTEGRSRSQASGQSSLSVAGGGRCNAHVKRDSAGRPYTLDKIDITYPILGPDALKPGDVVVRKIREHDKGIVTHIKRERGRIVELWVDFNGKAALYQPAELRRVRFTN